MAARVFSVWAFFFHVCVVVVLRAREEEKEKEEEEEEEHSFAAAAAAAAAAEAVAEAAGCLFPFISTLCRDYFRPFRDANCAATLHTTYPKINI